MIEDSKWRKLKDYRGNNVIKETTIDGKVFYWYDDSETGNNLNVFKSLKELKAWADLMTTVWK